MGIFKTILTDLKGAHAFAKIPNFPRFFFKKFLEDFKGRREIPIELYNLGMRRF